MEGWRQRQQIEWPSRGPELLALLGSVSGSLRHTWRLKQRPLMQLPELRVARVYWYPGQVASSLQHRVETNNNLQSHTCTILKFPIHFTRKVSDCGRKAGERTYPDTRRTCKLQTERPHSGIQTCDQKPFFFKINLKFQI